MKNFFIKPFSFCVMIFFFTILVACSGNKKTIDSNTKKDIIESEEDKTTVFNSTTSSLNQQTIKTDYEKYLSQETDFEGEEFIEEKQMPWQEYPRPQMKRENWMSLNGMWKLYGDDIRVPFAPQSELSGYKKKVKDTF